MAINVAQFKRQIDRKLAILSLDIFNEMEKRFKEEISLLIEKIIFSSETIQEILDRGPLLGELGLVDPEGKIAGIIAFMEQEDNLDARVSIRNEDGKRNPSFNLIYSFNTEELARIPAGLQEHTRVRGGIEVGVFGILPWLDWLLTYGDSVIIDGFQAEFTNTIGYSRSETGYLMFNSGGGWRVPAQHSGIENNNFITRAFEKNRTNIQNSIRRQFRIAISIATRRRKQL